MKYYISIIAGSSTYFFKNVTNFHKSRLLFWGVIAVISDSSSTHGPTSQYMVRPVRREVKGENFNVFIFHQADAQREFKERASVAVD